jgi:hypothetical protein
MSTKRKILTLTILLLVGALSFGAGVFLGDLVGIGGYDHFAPESLHNEFQYGRYAGTVWYKLAENSAPFLLVGGLLILVVLLGLSAFWAVKWVRTAIVHRGFTRGRT